MKTENTALDNGCQWQIIKETGKVLPNVGITIFPEAFVIKSINLSDLLALVISSKDSDSTWEPDFESNKKCYSLNRVISSIYVISHEKVVVVR